MDKCEMEISKFVDNFLKKNNNVPLRNLYIFKSEDKDGNITDMRYGVNLIIRGGYSAAPPTYSDHILYVGDGVGIPSYDDTALIHYLATAQQTSDASGVYPIQYDSQKGLIYQYRQCGGYSLDYTVLGTSFNVTEFGLYHKTAPVGLVTHGLILDSEGHPSYIEKRLYEKLTIDVRLLFVTTPEIQHRLINSGIYGIMPPFSFRQSIPYSASSTFGSNIRNVSSYWHCDGNYFPIDSVSGKKGVDHSINTSLLETLSTNAQIKQSNWITCPSLLNELWYEFVSCLRIGSEGTTSGIWNEFLLLMFVNGEPETLTSEYVFSQRSTETLDFSEMFQSVRRGAWDSDFGYGRFPVANFEILSSYMYNFEDHLWNIQDTTTSCATSDFHFSNWRYCVRKVFMINPNGIEKQMFIFVNDNVNIQITKFSNSGIVLYATDAWWDTSTWLLITNLNEVTLSQGTKRYYICESEDTLYPVRDQEYPKFICNGKDYTWSDDAYDAVDVSGVNIPAICCSDDYECYCTVNYIFFHPEGLPGGYDSQTSAVSKYLPFTYPAEIVGPNVTNTYLTPGYRHIFDDKMVICTQSWYSGTGFSNTTTSATHIRILDISDASINMDPNVDLPYVDLQLDFTNKTRSETSSSVISHKWDGDYWLSYEPKAKEVVAVKIHGGPNEDTPEQQLIDSDIASYVFDYGTNHIVYSKDGFTMYYYDLETGAVIDTFNVQDFDSAVATIDGYVGYNGVIYIVAKYSSGDWFTYFYNTSSQSWRVDKNTFTRALSAILTGTNCCGYNDRCAVFSTRDSSTNYDTIVIDADNPYEFIKSLSTNLRNVMPHTCQLKYVNNDKQLLLSLPSIGKYNNNSNDGSYYNLIDIGLLLDNQEWPPIYQQKLCRAGSSGRKIYQCCLYKDDVIYRGTFNEVTTYCINILPITKFLFHKVTIRTNTLTGYNNPFNIPQTQMFRLITSLNLDKKEIEPVATDSMAFCFIYRIDMYESSTLSHRFVPCTRDSDSVNGLYDTITDEFLEPLDPATIIADTSTPITTDYSLPSGYTQVYSISYTSGQANWFTTAGMSTPVIHTANTKIEWFGKIPTHASSLVSTCLFGSQEYENQNNHKFTFWANVTNGYFGYARNSEIVESAGTYDTDIKIVCDGVTATWYAISDPSTPLGNITLPFGTTMDNGVTPFAFITRGIPNGYDYTS